MKVFEMFSFCIIFACLFVFTSGNPVLNCNETTEILSTCGNLCDRTCANSLHRVVPCVRMCAPPACACKDGFVRYQGICIKKRDCPESSLTCREGEHINMCGSGCERTCKNANSTMVMCQRICMPRECVCNEGLVRIVNGCFDPSECD